MLRKFLLFILILPHAVFAEYSYTVNNTNLTVSQSSEALNADERYIYNYNRLRIGIDYTQEALFGTFIADSVNYLGPGYIDSDDFEYLSVLHADTPFKTQSVHKDYYEGSTFVKLYRFYLGYEDDKNRIVSGLQNISMGVGRIWTPTNLYNPKNIYAFESDEVFGVAAIAYTRHLDETSQVTFVLSQKSDKSLKYGARYKSFLEFADFALNAVHSDETKMIGYELEGNLADTGVELRSEGAYIRNSFEAGLMLEDETEFFQGIIGADYGFVNGVTLVAEALYSSKKFSYEEIVSNLSSEIIPNMVSSKLYTALSLSYSFTIFLDASLLYIESFNDKNSRFISPTLTYTMNDYNTFSLGAMLQDGEAGSDFADAGSKYFFKYSLAF
ncbi:hypothetical protein KJ877_00845 [bacterium]|nr:hypothetical protein [bacterium]MBU1989575.1 hypothetical protein [bacterium]